MLSAVHPTDLSTRATELFDTYPSYDSVEDSELATALPICDDDWEDYDNSSADADYPAPPPIASPCVPPLPVASTATSLQSNSHPPLSECHGAALVPESPIATVSEVDYDETYLAASPSSTTPFPLATSEWHPAILLTSLLCAWLHVAGHLSFHFCDTVLVVIGYIFCEFGQRQLMTSLPSSLRGILSSLRLDHLIHILPCCPQCSYVCSEKAYANHRARCPVCQTPLFTLTGSPRLRFPYISLEEQLRKILMVPGMEDQMASWRKRVRTDGRLHDIFDGKICRTLCGPDGLSFFRFDLQEDPDNEIRLGVAFGLDWSVITSHCSKHG